MAEAKLNLKRNYLFSLFQQAVTVVLPLVTVPYLSRVLGPDGLGIVAFSGSMVQYFTLIGGLGLALYGNRAVARVRDNRSLLSKTFWEIFTLRSGLSLLSLLFYLLSLLVFKPAHVEVYLVQSALIFSATLDLSWLYMALEDFKKIAIRNVFIRLIGLILIFFLVRRPEDFIKYAAISVLTELLGQTIYWVNISALVQNPNWKNLEWCIHLRSTIGLYVPQLAIQVYVVLDKTMLGLLSSIPEVALYAQPEKIIKALLLLITTLGTVMLPRMNYLFASGKEKEFFAYAKKSLLLTSYGTFLFAALAFATSETLMPLFLGQNFSASSKVFRILSPIIILIGFSNVLGTQMLIPMGREKVLSLSVVIGALANFTGNLFLIPRFGANGAAAATLFAEFLVAAVQFAFLRQGDFFKGIYRELFVFFLGSIACIAVISTFKSLLFKPFLAFFTMCSSGLFIYLVILELSHSETQKWLFGRIVGVKAFK